MSPGFILVGNPGSPVRFFVDDVVFFDGGPPETVARDLTPPWAPRAATLYFSDFEEDPNGFRGVKSCVGAVGKGVNTSVEDRPFVVVYRPRHREPREGFVARTGEGLSVAFFARPPCAGAAHSSRSSASWASSINPRRRAISRILRSSASLVTAASFRRQSDRRLS